MAELVGRTAFVGRATELAAIAGGLENARAGRGGIVLVAGEPGIGKTRMAEEFVSRAGHSDVRSFWGRCYEGDGAPAFWPWVQIIREMVRALPSDRLHPLLGQGAADMAAVVPVIHEYLPDLPQTTVLDEYARFRFFEAVTAFLRRVSETEPLVLVLDDLHWADAPSLLLLRFLAGTMARSRILIVGTYRDAEVTRDHPLADALVALTREGTDRMTLRGLGEADLAEYVEHIIGHRSSPSLIAGLQDGTEGNPFFVAEVVRLLASEGRLESAGAFDWVIPERVREVIRQRLDRLSPRCQTYLRVAAVIGREFRFGTLARIDELEDISALMVLDEAETARVLTAVVGHPGHFRFAHALIRETLYEDLTNAVRIRLHRQVGLALEEEYGTHPESHLAELAFHWVQAAPASDAEKAVDYATRAAERAMRLLAYEEAARHYDMALRALLLDRPDNESRYCDLLLALGEARERGGDRGLAANAFHQAAEGARSLGDAERFARAALGYGGPTAVTNVADPTTIGLLEEGLRLLGPADHPLRARVTARLADEIYFLRQPARRVALGREAVAIARRVGDPATLAVALHALHWSLWSPDTVQERLAVATELFQVAAQVGNAEFALLGHNWRIIDLAELGRFEDVDREIDTLDRLATDSRQPYYIWIAMLRRAARVMMSGRFDEGERLMDQALAIGRRVQPETAVTYFMVQMYFRRREEGRVDELAPIYEDYSSRSGTSQVYLAALAWLYAELDRVDDARRLFEQIAAGEFAGVERDYAWFGAMLSLTEVCTFLGDASRAAKLYALLRPYAERCILAGRFAVCAGSAQLPLGMLATTAENWEHAAVHFERALLVNARIGARPYLAWTRYHYARMLWLRDGMAHRAVIDELLAGASTLSGEMGMSRLTDRIGVLRREIDDAVARSGIARRSALPDGLTPREAEVLRLLAMGRTTKEIASDLVVSAATIERHITNLYGKIGARSRADATAYAFRTGLIDLDHQ